MHTDKPISLSVRDYIIRRLASQLMLSEDVISLVITHQYSTGNIATRTLNSIEFSGLGKFFFSEKKGRKKLEDLIKIQGYLETLKESSPEKKENYNKKLSTINEQIEYIKLHLNELD